VATRDFIGSPWLPESDTTEDADADLSIAFGKWNDTIVRLAPDSRAALLSQIAAEVQHLG
jgi:hypothetical protein